MKVYYNITFRTYDLRNIQIGVAESEEEAQQIIDEVFAKIKEIYPSLEVEGSVKEPGPIHASVRSYDGVKLARFMIMTEKLQSRNENVKDILSNNIKEILDGKVKENHEIPEKKRGHHDHKHTSEEHGKRKDRIRRSTGITIVNAKDE